MKGAWRDIYESLLEYPFVLMVIFIAMNVGDKDIGWKEVLVMVACILGGWIIGYFVVRGRNKKSRQEVELWCDYKPSAFDKKAAAKDIFKALDLPIIFSLVSG